MLNYMMNLNNKIGSYLRRLEHKKRKRLEKDLFESNALSQTLWEIHHFVSTTHIILRAMQVRRIFRHHKKFKDIAYVRMERDGVEVVITNGHGEIRGNPRKVVEFVRQQGLEIYDKNLHQYLCEYQEIMNILEELNGEEDG